MQGLTPKGKQEEVLALPATGHIVVLGTAGSGKTTIAVLRAEHLANMPTAGKVLLVTFNGALAEYMRKISSTISCNLVVENYHKFAKGYLNSRGMMPYNCILKDNDVKTEYIAEALETLKRVYPEEPTLKRSLEFFVDEISFMQKFGYTDKNDYLVAERIGRASANVKREKRPFIFLVYEKYLELRKNNGYLYDWDDIAMYTYQELCNDTSERRYSHIIVDEGQDFSPMMIKSLVKAVGQNGSFSFFGDVAQQIYGSRLSWRDSAIQTNKIWRFDVNYRNPASVSDFAKDIMQSRYWQKSNDIIEASSYIAEGPQPVLIHFSCEQNELNWIIKQAMQISKNSSAVIICRNRSDIHMINEMISKAGGETVIIDKNTAGFANVKKLYLSTYHAAKGLEFDNVFIPYLSSERFPNLETLCDSRTDDEIYADELKLLYVAATRSKYGLYMTYSGELSVLFPAETKHCKCIEEEELNVRL